MHKLACALGSWQNFQINMNNYFEVVIAIKDLITVYQ